MVEDVKLSVEFIELLFLNKSNVIVKNVVVLNFVVVIYVSGNVFIFEEGVVVVLEIIELGVVYI